MFTACSSNSSLMSSFSQRKYTKGYFVNNVGEQPLVVSHRTDVPETKTVTVNNNQALTGVRQTDVKKSVHTVHQAEQLLTIKQKDRYIQVIAEKVTNIDNISKTKVDPATPKPAVDQDLLKTGRILMVLGVVLILLVIFSVFPGLSGAIALLGALFFVWGLISISDALKNSSE